MYKLYVGSNNETKELEMDKIESILQANLDGYTLYSARGCWKGVSEDSVIIEVQGVSYEKIMEIASTLRDSLEQDAVALQEVPDLSFI